MIENFIALSQGDKIGSVIAFVVGFGGLILGSIAAYKEYREYKTKPSAK